MASIKASKPIASITIKADGTHIPLDKFRKLLDSFIDTLKEIDKETSEDQHSTVFWNIHSLTYNSPLLLKVEATPNTEHIDPERPYQVIDMFRSGISTLEQPDSQAYGFSYKARRIAKNMVKILDPNDLAEITFFGSDWQAQIRPDLITKIEEKESYYRSYGSVEGYLKSINLVKQKKFGIVTKSQSSIVHCYFKDDLLFEKAKEYLDKRVYVYGIVRKNDSSKILNINVIEIDRLPEAQDTPSAQEMLRHLWEVS